MKAFFISLGLSVLCSSVMLADSSKIAPDLRNQGGGKRQSVIIQYKGIPSASALSTLPLLGGVLTTTLKAVNALVVSLPISALEALSNSAEVVYISPDRPLTQLLDYSTAAVNAQVAKSAGLTGAGVGVAVIDSGVADSADLGALVLPRVIYHQSFVNPNGMAVNAVSGLLNTGSKDGFGHGTHVAGIIAGNGTSSSCLNCTRSLTGLAPNANIIDLQVLDANGQGNDSAVIAAIGSAIQLKQTFNIRVINLSLGRPVFESYTLDPLCKAVEAAWKAGIVVNVAAGNNGRDNSVGNQGYGTIQSPGNDPYVITVGAMKTMSTYSRTDDLIASYSSKGPSGIDFVAKPDLVAPGNHVVSLESANSLLSNDAATAVPLSYYQATTNGNKSANFMMLNGTSMATPVVSGAVADMLQADPSLTPDQVKARLMKTAYKQFPASSTATDPVTGQVFTSEYDLFTVGAGYLDLGAALANHDVAPGTALSPIASYDAASNLVHLTTDPTATWVSGNQSVWGTRAVWGTTTVKPDQSVWGSQAVWGTSTVSGFQSIWGTRGVWGTESDAATSVTQGTRAVWGTNTRTSDSDTVFSVHQ